MCDLLVRLKPESGPSGAEPCETCGSAGRGYRPECCCLAIQEPRPPLQVLGVAIQFIRGGLGRQLSRMRPALRAIPLRPAAVMWELIAVVDWNDQRRLHAGRIDGGRFSAHGL